MPDWQLFRTETRGREKLQIGKKRHLKIVHFTPESIVHYTPDCIVQYSPEYSVLQLLCVVCIVIGIPTFL